MRIPVVRIYNGERIPMPLPACTDIVVNICSPYRRISLAYTIDVTEDNVILAKVEGDQLYVGKYALEVKGKIGGVDWRSNEYEQIAIVDNNASADTSFVKYVFSISLYINQIITYAYADVRREAVMSVAITTL